MGNNKIVGELLLGIIFIESEYGMKQFIESFLNLNSCFSRRSYWLYRALYFITLLALLYAVFEPTPWPFVLALSATMIASTDRLLCQLQQWFQNWTGSRFRWMQILPLVGLIAISWIAPYIIDLIPSVSVKFLWGWISSFSFARNLTPVAFVQYVAGYVFLAQPTNYLIRWLIDKESDSFFIEVTCSKLAGTSQITQRQVATAREENMAIVQRETLRAGRIIGILERWMLATFVLLTQYGALGLVLTAKSVARFKQIEQDSTFAEYYLLGTLYSTLAALVVGLVLSTL